MAHGESASPCQPQWTPDPLTASQPVAWGWSQIVGGLGCLGSYKSLPSPNVSFHPSRGPHGEAVGNCRARMQVPSDERWEAPGCPAPFVPGLGWGTSLSPCVPSLAPPGPTLAPGSTCHSPPGFLGQWPGFQVLQALLSQEPSSSPGLVLPLWSPGPLILPFPCLCLFPPPWPFTSRACCVLLPTGGAGRVGQ